MNLLGIDTSSKNLSIAIMRKGEIIVDFNRRMAHGASQIVPCLAKELKCTGMKLTDFDVFVLGKGPGSFTGLRVSYSIVKAFMLTTKKPVITIGSFVPMAHALCQKRKKVAVIADARRDLIYAASFVSFNNTARQEGSERLVVLSDYVAKKRDYCFVTYDEHLRQAVQAMSGVIDFFPKNVWPRASFLLESALDYYTKKIFTPIERLEPLYLHPKTCQIRK